MSSKDYLKICEQTIMNLLQVAKENEIMVNEKSISFYIDLVLFQNNKIDLSSKKEYLEFHSESLKDEIFKQLNKDGIVKDTIYDICLIKKNLIDQQSNRGKYKY